MRIFSRTIRCNYEVLVRIRISEHSASSGYPLIIGVERTYREAQADLTRLPLRGRPVIAQNSGYFVPRYEPELAAGPSKEMGAGNTE